MIVPTDQENINSGNIDKAAHINGVSEDLAIGKIEEHMFNKSPLKNMETRIDELDLLRLNNNKYRTD